MSLLSTPGLVAVLVTVVVFLGLDAIWLKTVIGPFFRERIGHIMREEPLLGIAAGFYILYAIIAVYFVVLPQLPSGEVGPVLLHGALIGLLGYGTYEATSMAVMKDWRYSMVALDVGWGMFVTAVSCAAGFYAARAIAG